MSLNHLPTPVHVGADLSALGILIGWLAGLLPAFAALFACIWYFIQIWESKTVRKLTGRDS
jgi:hypothetical protein